MTLPEPAQADSVILRVENLGRSVPGKILVSGATFEVRKGETLAIVGPSGSGKSSLLRLLNRLDEPTTALDEAAKRDVETLIRQIGQEHGIPRVLVTHDVAQAARLAERALVLEGGQIVRSGPVKEALHA